MGLQVKQFNTINEMYLSNIDEILPEYYYDTGTEVNSLRRVQETSNVFILEDPKYLWEYEKDGFTLEMNFTVNNPNSFFGPNGLVSDDSKLGFALIWHSKSSAQRYVKELALITKNSNDPITISAKQKFVSGKYFGNITYEIIVYLAECGFIKEQDKPKLSGTKLGEIFSETLSFDGGGLVFPIIERANGVNQPLWNVEFNFTDPTSQMFDIEYLNVTINKDHPAFPLLNRSNSKNGSLLYSEILASALQVIIQKIKESEEWNQIQSGEELKKGSIGEVIHYFLQQHNWDVSSPERLAESIRMNVKINNEGEA